jgi:hypothetical protein
MKQQVLLVGTRWLAETAGSSFSIECFGFAASWSAWALVPLQTFLDRQPS